MSGGVDSSVAAALLLEQGYNVIGATMKIYSFDDVGGNVGKETSCCGLDGINDARMVAVRLGIPHYVFDFTKQFREQVIDNFIDEYVRGRTPNPCIVCNRAIKWGELLSKADALGADFIATGHYARLRYDETRRRYVISKAKHDEKDQSYALWGLSQESLSKTLFPLGELSKPQVRDIAEKLGLKNAAKEESFEVCFLGDDDYERFLKEQLPDLETSVGGGDVVFEGRIVGKHRGYPFYTIGQRKGIGAYGERVYVTEIDSATNTVHVGREADLMHTGLVASNVNLVAADSIAAPMKVAAKVRYKDVLSPATAWLTDDGKLKVVFDEPKRAIAPGQSVVIYEGEALVGGGVIDEVIH
jgi:tRNA-specific 2-thiouridylase